MWIPGWLHGFSLDARRFVVPCGVLPVAGAFKPRAVREVWSGTRWGTCSQMTQRGCAHRANRITTILCDADGTLYSSEEPAFAASVGVTNRFLRSLGVRHEHTADALRRATTGLTFRRTATNLARQNGVELDDDGSALTTAALERWVAEENRVVTGHLENVLTPDPAVERCLAHLATQFDLAVVTSSASSRLDACLRVAQLEQFFPTECRFSAETSLPRPTSKPHPAIYLHALERLGIDAGQAVAIEDSAAGATAAMTAGIVTYVNLAFTPSEEREGRAAELMAAGAAAIARTWDELDEMLSQLSSPNHPVSGIDG
jgi:HAD superfamily hydrolase (TIGR01509 family)